MSQPLVLLLFYSLFGASVLGLAQPALGASSETQSVIVDPVIEAAKFRPWIITGHYSLLDLTVPNKIGFAVELRDEARRSWAIEYSRGSFSPFFIKDLGSFSEARLTLTRRYSGEGGAGFQFFYGGFYQEFKLAIGGALLNRLTGGYYPDADLVALNSLGAVVGVGYRWLIDGRFAIAIEGIAWSQPLVSTSRENKFLQVATNQTDRDDVETLVRIVEYFPRFAVAKLAVGYAF